jgi:hypothetical protein
MKNVRIKVRQSCGGLYFDFGIFANKALIMRNNVGRQTYWERKAAAIRNAKAIAKRIGIKYDPEIVKMHGC